MLFYALVDALTGREGDVEAALRQQGSVRGVVRCKEKNHDLLIKFEAPDLTMVDDFLQTHVRRIQGVAAVEIVLDWADHSQLVREARASLDRS